ncbi:MAG: nucleotide pyrophosphohydrolase [Rhodobiaceae bacterium]|nr:nucleotide pyrophosphohydrolase [Rhodobiaceae bacterium]
MSHCSSLDINEYQQMARKTAIYPDAGNPNSKGANITYPTLGLSGEAGEVAEKVKKVIRDKGGQFDDDTRAAICKELGDVLWYVAQIASELNLDLSNVAQGNLDKLADRAKRGKIKGNGDDR